MARNRTFSNLQNKINAINLTPQQKQNLLEVFNTLNRRYFQKERLARKDNKRTEVTRYVGAKSAVMELVETFNGNNVLVSDKD